MTRSKLLIPILFSLAIAALANTRSVSKAQARQLVLKLLQSEGYDTSSASFELEEIKDPYFPDFYQFGARVDNPERFDSAGTYIVDPRTADVQEMTICAPPKAKTVRNFQAQLRRNIGLSDSEYRKLKERRPLPCLK